MEFRNRSSGVRQSESAVLNRNQDEAGSSHTKMASDESQCEEMSYWDPFSDEEGIFCFVKLSKQKKCYPKKCWVAYRHTG